jgi:hypothetical protein
MDETPRRQPASDVAAPRWPTMPHLPLLDTLGNKGTTDYFAKDDARSRIFLGLSVGVDVSLADVLRGGSTVMTAMR